MKRSKPRILIAGYEIGGQMQLLAETLRKKGFQADSAAFSSDFRNYRNDFNIKTRKLPLQRLMFFARAMRRYDVFHFFWGVSLLDFWRFSALDLPLLKKLNKKVIVHFRGTDVVNIAYYDFLISRALGNAMDPPPRTRPDQHKKLLYWKKYADHILVSTPDLLEVVPEATLVPQVMDLDAVPANNGVANSVFRIGHAPTRRNTKGTDFIVATVDQLKREGYDIDLDLIEQATPDIVLQRFQRCDVGIDQLLSGWYGKVSVELMAMGKPVLCFIADKFKGVYNDLPIVNTTVQTLKEVLLQLQANRDDLQAMGLRCRKYAEKHHDVSQVVDQLLDSVYCIDTPVGGKDRH